MEEESIQLIHGVLDDVRPPVLDFKVIDNSEDYKEYIIKTHKNSKEKSGENPFVNYLESFIFCDDGKDVDKKKTFELLDIFKDRTQDLKIPIVSNLPIGHCCGNASLPLGRQAILNGKKGSLSLLK